MTLHFQQNLIPQPSFTYRVSHTKLFGVDVLTISRITEHVYATCDFIYSPSAIVLWTPFTYSPYFVLIIGSMGLQLFVLGAGLARVAFVFTIEAVHSCAFLTSPFLLCSSAVYDLTITTSKVVTPPKVRHLREIRSCDVLVISAHLSALLVPTTRIDLILSHLLPEDFGGCELVYVTSVKLFLAFRIWALD